MTVVHDAYLFQPCGFANHIVELTRESSGNWSLSYAKLREAALTALRRNSVVRELADRYGGWDENSLTRELPTDAGSQFDDFVVWVSLILYDHFLAQDLPPPRGLGETWSETQACLCMAGWSSGDAKLAIDGNPFISLFTEMNGEPAVPPNDKDDLRMMMMAFRPPSTASSAGWLSSHDVMVLQDRLVAINRPEEALNRLKHIFGCAVQFHAGLCMIKSG
jgi:hypothetical protein